MTALAQVFAGSGRPDLNQNSWVEWRNVKNTDQLPGLVLSAFLRSRGGLAAGESLTVQVFTHLPGMAKHPNGRPDEILGTTYVCTKE
jgi:hypothetical protein